MQRRQATGIADLIHVFHACDAHHHGAEDEGRDDHLEWLDEGVGQRLHLPPEQGGTVFDAFSSHQPGGMGMGLAICRSIADSHHGRTDLADSPDPLGAEFTL